MKSSSSVPLGVLVLLVILGCAIMVFTGCGAAASGASHAQSPTTATTTPVANASSGTPSSGTPSSPSSPAPSPSPTPTPTPPPPTAPPTHHIFVVAEENTSYSLVVNNSSPMPFFYSLLAQGTLWGNYYANSHGSMNNYIEVLSGQTFNCNGNDCGASGALTGASLMNGMNAHSLSWKGYFDGLSSCGQLAPAANNWIISPDANGNNYYQRHTGFPWYAVGTATIAGCGSGGNGWWPMSQFSADLANHAFGNFNWITPDGSSDAHDGSLQQADAFLKQWLAPLLASSYFQPGGDGILILWWDEGSLSDGSCGGPGGNNCGGQVAVLVLGPAIRTNSVDNSPANHDSTLRFIQEQLGLTPTLGNSVNVPDMAQTLN